MKIVQKFNDGTQSILDLSNTEFHRRRMILNLINDEDMRNRLLNKLNDLSDEHKNLVNELMTVTEISLDNNEDPNLSASIHP